MTPTATATPESRARRSSARRRRSPSRVLALVAALLATTVLVGACSDDSGSEQAFCQKVTKVPTIDILIAGYADADPAELDSRLDGASESYDALRRAAPDEVRDSVATVVDLVDAVIGAVRDHPNDPEAVADEVRTATAEVADAPAATAEVATYASEHCGVELNPTVDDPAAPSTTADAKPGGT